MRTGYKQNPKNQFQKGNKLGKGRPKMPQEVNELKALSKAEVDATLFKFLQMDISTLIEFSKNPLNKSLEMLVAQVIIQAIKKGDHMRLDFLLNRTVGKVKDTIETTIKTDAHQTIIDLIEKLNLEQKGE